MSESSLEVVKKLDESVLKVIGSKAIHGFEKANIVSQAIVDLTALLTDEYMKPIMALQGNKLGFLTDKDKTGGYSLGVVKKCLIEAVLSGLQPTGNKFNIIAGNMYPTKEGCGDLLDDINGLDYTIVCDLPVVNATKTGAAVTANIEWEYNGIKKEKKVPIPIKMDGYTSVDSLIGKATRKARAWLISKITGTEITSGDVTDIDSVVVETTPVEKGEAKKEELRNKVEQGKINLP